MAEMAPFIVEYLLDKYEEEVDISPSVEGHDLYRFLKWCKEFMDKHRPSTFRSVEGSYVIQLTNGDEVSISPPLERGSMQPSGRAIPVTGHETAKEMLRGGGPMGGKQ